jgi:hypothetical protein
MAAPYVPDPATRETPVHTDEVRALLDDGGKALRDRRVAGHFLHRVEVTLEGNRRDFAGLHRQVAEMRIKGTDGGGTSGGLDPWAAARFLPQEEFDKRASSHLRAKLQQVDGALIEITEAQRKVIGRVNAIKYAVGTLLDDPALPQDVKDRFLELVQSLPDDAPVSVPEVSLPVPDESWAREAVLDADAVRSDAVAADWAPPVDDGAGWAPPVAEEMVAVDPAAGQVDDGAGWAPPVAEEMVDDRVDSTGEGSSLDDLFL